MNITKLTAIKYEKEYRGGWELFSENSGVSAMHMIMMPNSNKAIMFDRCCWLWPI